MNSHTSLVAQQTHLSEWAEMIRNCQNRPQGMTIDEWCQLHDITKESYYWRLRKVREELHASNEKMQLLMEQVILGKQNRFGRSSEKMEDSSQKLYVWK